MRVSARRNLFLSGTRFETTKLSQEGRHPEPLRLLYVPKLSSSGISMAGTPSVPVPPENEEDEMSLSGHPPRARGTKFHAPDGE